jgi:hypothetical protein
MKLSMLASVRRSGLVSTVAMLVTFGAAPMLAQSPQTLNRYSFTIQGAAGLPQDIWVSALGSNLGGWESGGSLCLGPLAQGLDIGQHTTILTNVIEAGILGVDGQPVAAGDYFAPGIEVPSRNFTLTNGKSFYVIMDGFVAESNIPMFPARAHVPFMFTFEFVQGHVEQEMVTWTQDPEGNWFPFLNEGLQSTNIRLVN